MSDMTDKEMKKCFHAFMKEHYLLNRTAVSDDTDKLVRSVQKQLDCNIIEVPSGSECLTWIIPKFWKVHDAYLARLDGTRIVDFKENPLHLWSHSIGFKGEIDRVDLEKHLYYDPRHADWVPFHYRNGFRFDAEDWGFCLSYNDYTELTDNRYYVHIDADLNTNGSMKIIDHLIPGENPETIFFAAHTCHPGQVADGLSNIAVLVHLFNYLKTVNDLKYSYRLILGPEYFAAAGFLASVSEDDIASLKGGIYFDMIGNGQPFCFQSSFQADSVLDKIIENVFNHHVLHHRKTSFREVFGNDEIFYNGTGFMIPTCGIVCDRYPEYHFHKDDLDLVNLNQLESAYHIIRKIIRVLEEDFIPVPNFRGPIYLSRYDLYIDPKIDRKGYDNIQNMQFLMNGERSCFDIASHLDTDFFFVKDFCDKLEQVGLIEIRPFNLFEQ